MKKLVIDGVTYVENSDVQLNTENVVLVRTYSAGVHLGVIEKEEHFLSGKELTLKNTRRLWSWEGAFTLSELALRGSSKIDKCRLSVIIPTNTISGVIEVMPMTEVSSKQLMGAAAFDPA